ncbi:predicted protein [Streptomyces sp. AA4]|nr:predicted protein [Streptomyces sp. AA4]
MPRSGSAPVSESEIVTHGRRVRRRGDRHRGRRPGFRSGAVPPVRCDVLGEFASLAAEGKFSIPVSRIFPLGEWRAAR